jgi:hypothetical protein
MVRKRADILYQGLEIMNIIWCGLSFILGLVVMKYMENKDFKEKVNQSIKNLFKKKPPVT